MKLPFVKIKGGNMPEIERIKKDCTKEIVSKEYRRITRKAKNIVINEEGIKYIEIVPVTNDYLKEGDEFFLYVKTPQGSGYSMGLFKVSGENLLKLKKDWNKGEVIESLRGQRIIDQKEEA